MALQEGPACSRSEGSGWGQSGLGPRAQPDGPTRGTRSLKSREAAEALGLAPEGSGFPSSFCGVASSAAKLHRSVIKIDGDYYWLPHDYVSGNTIEMYGT